MDVQCTESTETATSWTSSSELSGISDMSAIGGCTRISTGPGFNYIHEQVEALMYNNDVTIESKYNYSYLITESSTY